MYFYNDMRNVKIEKKEEQDTDKKGLYLFDRYDDEMYLTDCVLFSVVNAIRKYEELYEKYIRLRIKIENVGAYDYESAGKLGCKVSGGSGRDLGDRVLDMIEMEETYKESLSNIQSEKQKLHDIIWECNSLTETQKKVLYYRHDSNPARYFDEIARMTGLKNYDSAWYQYKKAYSKFSIWLSKTDYVLQYVS